MLKCLTLIGENHDRFIMGKLAARPTATGNVVLDVAGCEGKHGKKPYCKTRLGRVDIAAGFCRNAGDFFNSDGLR